MATRRIGTRELGSADLTCPLVLAALGEGTSLTDLARTAGVDVDEPLSESARRTAHAFESALLTANEHDDDPFGRLRDLLAQAGHADTPATDPVVRSYQGLEADEAAAKVAASARWVAADPTRWAVMRNVAVTISATIDGTTVTEHGEIDGLVVLPGTAGAVSLVVAEAKATGDLWVSDEDRASHWGQATSYARAVRAAVPGAPVDTIVVYRDASRLGNWPRVDRAHPDSRDALMRARDDLLAEYADIASPPRPGT